ncbi:hypothetical protein WA158_004341 [Blastocystis sp. Blastoise]
MVKERILFSEDPFMEMGEYINVCKEMMKDVHTIISSVLDFSNHSGSLINGIIRCIQKYNDELKQDTNNCFSISCDNSKKRFQNDYRYKRKYEDNETEDENIDLIRFTSRGPVFSLSKNIINSIPYSYIYEQSSDELRTSDGTVYLDYRGNEACVYYLLDYLNGKHLDFSQFTYEEQIDIIELFEFCGLPLPEELIFIRERRDTKKVKYREDNIVDLIINGNKDTIIKEYLVKNGLWNTYIMNYNNGFVDFNHIDESLFINKKFDYLKYLIQYIEKEYIVIDEDEVVNINKDRLENELYELFGTKGKEATDNVITTKPTVFKNSKIIEKKCYETPLVKWLGKEKRWVLLFRASEHNFSSKEFHNYCDNLFETVTLIKHKSYNNDGMNIFGGYTDQQWTYYGAYKPYSNEFLFTLKNEHNIPPTKYDYINIDSSFGILCSSQWGPTFGNGYDICISDDCHENATSYCNSCSYSTVNTPQKNSLFVNTGKENSQNHFLVEDYEVWGRDL